MLGFLPVLLAGLAPDYIISPKPSRELHSPMVGCTLSVVSKAADELPVLLAPRKIMIGCYRLPTIGAGLSKQADINRIPHRLVSGVIGMKLIAAIERWPDFVWVRRVKHNLFKVTAARRFTLSRTRR